MNVSIHSKYSYRRLLLSLFLFIFLSGFTLFTFNGTFIKWNVKNGESVTFILNPAGCDCDLTEEQVLEIFEKSLARWSDVKGSFFKFENLADVSPELFEADDTLSSSSPKYDDDKNVIGFSDAVPEGFAGFTQFRTDGNHIVEADIFLGAGLDYEADTLESLLTHELGHALGLGHDHADVASIMSYGREAGKTKLGVDDVIGIITIYPKSGREPKPDLGCTTIMPVDGEPPFLDNAFWNLVLILSFPFFLIWGLKTKKWNRPTVSKQALLRGALSLNLVVLLSTACSDIQEDTPNGNIVEMTHAIPLENEPLPNFTPLEAQSSTGISWLESSSDKDAPVSRSADPQQTGPKIEGGDFFTVIKPGLHGDKVTFFCPKGT